MSDNFYIKSNFDNFNDMAKALYQWNIEIRQLEEGKINDTLTQIKINDIFLQHAIFTGKTHQIGQIPPGRTFVFHKGEESKLLWRKKDIPLDGLMIFPLGSQLDVVTKGVANTPYAITISDDKLMERFTAHQRKIYKKIVSTQDLVIIPTSEMENLQTIYDKYLQSLEEDAELIHLKIFQKCFEEEIISALMRALCTQVDDAYAYSQVKNSDIWEQLEDYIEEHKHRAIRVSELSYAGKISERSLHRLFNERFEVTPKAYLNKLRLNGARLDLKKSSNRDMKISEIANNWGFWHMGQFAADYKLLFHELPSETLEYAS